MEYLIVIAVIAAVADDRLDMSGRSVVGREGRRRPRQGGEDSRRESWSD